MAILSRVRRAASGVQPSALPAFSLTPEGCFYGTLEVRVGNGPHDRRASRDENRRDAVDSLIGRLQVLLHDGPAVCARGEHPAKRRSVEADGRPKMHQNSRIADVFGPTEESLEEGQIEGGEQPGVCLANPSGGLQGRQARSRVPIAHCRKMKFGRVRILNLCRMAVGKMVVAESPVRPILRDQDETPMRHVEAIAELLFQTPQANRPAVAPGSEVVGIHRDLENHGTTGRIGGTHRLPRHVGQGQSVRRKL